MNNPSLQLLDLLQSLCRLTRSEQRALGGEDQLQPVHLEALAYLGQANRYSNTPQALSEYLGSTKGTVSQSLLLLFRRGLVERETDAKDRRVVRLRLSSKGRELLDQLRGGEDWLRAFEAIAEDRVRVALEVLAQLLTNRQRQRGGRRFGVCRACRHFQDQGEGEYRCGLTGEALSEDDADRLCREHEAAEPAASPSARKN